MKNLIGIEDLSVKEIDELIDSMSNIVAQGINLAM